MNRRKFLKFLGMGAAAGPSAARQTLADLVNPTLAPLVGGSGIAPAPPPVADDVASGGALTRSALRVLGVPDWLRQEWRDSAKYIAQLDPDLVACRSYSLSAKLLMQRERNERRAEERFWDYGAHMDEKADFIKRFGRIAHWW